MRVFVPVAFVLGLVAAQVFPDDAFRRWQWQRSIVDGDYLYIVGGEVYTVNTTDNTAFVDYDSGIHIIDIAQPWNISTVSTTTISTQDTNMKVRRPSLFYDSVNKSINIYGGWPYTTDTPVVPYLSSWPADSGVNVLSHARFGLDSGKGFPYTRKAGSLAVASDKAYYSLGGFGTSNTDPEFEGLTNPLYLFTESGLLELDFQSENMANTSTTSNRIHGEAQFIPIFGDEGVLIFFGGDKPTTSTYSTAGALVDMSTITVYDIKSGKFYDQETIGSTAPVSRCLFCSVAVGGSSNSSYEIFIFGGLPGTVSTSTEADMGTVYILSLPAFQWTKTTVTSDWRYGNTCQLLGVGKSQMLNIGGVGSLSDFTTKDSFTSGLKVFNLNTLEWQDTYDPGAKGYSTPGNVSSLYDSSGNPETAVAFSDPALTAIFKSTTSSSTNTPTASPTSNPKSTKSVTPTGAIVGGVLGGVAIVAALTVLGVFLLRRRKRQKDGAYHPAANVELDGLHSGSYPLRKEPGLMHEMGVNHELDPRNPQELDTWTAPRELG